MKEGFERLKIKVEDNKIILRILDKLRGRCLHDIGEESLQYVMNYAKKFHPKMTTLNQDFVDALADSIINNTIIGAIINYIGDQSEEVEKADEDAVTMQDLKEVFRRLKIRVDNDNIIRKILNLLRDYNIHDRREESIQYVMKHAKKLHAKRIHSKMNILNQGFVESLEKSILSLPIQFGEITFDNDCEEAEDSDDEPPPKRPKRSSRKAKKDAKRKLKKSNNSNFSKKEKKNGKPNLKTSNISNSSKKKIKGANKKRKICRNSNINKKKKDANGGQKKSKNSNLSKKEKKNAKAKTKKSRNSNSTKKKKKDANKKSSRLSSTKKAKKIQKNN